MGTNWGPVPFLDISLGAFQRRALLLYRAELTEIIDAISAEAKLAGYDPSDHLPHELITSRKRWEPEPMTPDDVIHEISQQATDMLGRGQTPRRVRVGRIQAEALERGGHPGDTLTVPAARTARQIFTGPGETNPAGPLDHVSLLVERTADESHLEVV